MVAARADRCAAGEPVCRARNYGGGRVSHYDGHDLDRAGCGQGGAAPLQPYVFSSGGNAGSGHGNTDSVGQAHGFAPGRREYWRNGQDACPFGFHFFPDRRDSHFAGGGLRFLAFSVGRRVLVF